MTTPSQITTYSQNSMTGERMPSDSAQLPLKRSRAEDRFSGDVEDTTLKGVSAEEGGKLRL